MKKETALKIICWIAIAGVLFSGYLSYAEVFQGTCALGICRVTVLSVPPCVYGFFMYLIVLLVACCGLKNKNANTSKKRK